MADQMGASDGKIIAKLGELVGLTVDGVWRVAADSPSARIVLRNMLVLTTSDQQRTIECRQDGLTITGLESITALTWRGGDLDEDEALILASIEDGAVLPALPFVVNRVEIWYTTDNYEEVYLVRLSSADDQLVLTIGDGDFEIRPVSIEHGMAFLAALHDTSWLDHRRVMLASVTAAEIPPPSRTTDADAP